MESNQIVVLIVGLVLLLAGVAFFLAGASVRRRLSSVAGARAAGAGEVAGMAGMSGIGMVELSGTAESGQPLMAPLSNRPCVYYRLKVEERRVRYERSESGHSQRRESWETVADSSQFAPLMIRDGTGEVRVETDGAKVEAIQTVKGAYGAPGYNPSGSGAPGGALGEILGRALSMGTSAGLRSSEWIIPAGESAIVLGTVASTGSGAVITRGEGTLIISTRSKEELTRKYRRHHLLWTAAGACAAAGGVAAGVIALVAMK